MVISINNLCIKYSVNIILKLLIWCKRLHFVNNDKLIKKRYYCASKHCVAQTSHVQTLETVFIYLPLNLRRP